VEEREYAREILRINSELRKVDIAKIQSGNDNCSNAATGEL
jgi:hypothetical protein